MTATTWVDAAPFRAHLVQLQAATGWPWRAIALAAGVPAPCARSLLLGRDGRRVRKIRACDAAALIALTPQRLADLRHASAPARRAREAVAHLLEVGVDVETLTAWCGVGRLELAQLLDPRVPWCSAQLLVRARAAAEAHGWQPADRTGGVPRMQPVTGEQVAA